MPLLDSRLQLKILKSISSEINGKTLAYFLMANSSVVDKLSAGLRGEAYWPRHREWSENAPLFNCDREAVAAAEGVTFLKTCLPQDEIPTSLKDRWSLLLSTVFMEYFPEEDAPRQLTELCRRYGAPAEMVAALEALPTLEDMVQLLTDLAAEKGVLPTVAKNPPVDKNDLTAKLAAMEQRIRELEAAVETERQRNAILQAQYDAYRRTLEDPSFLQRKLELLESDMQAVRALLQEANQAWVSSYQSVQYAPFLSLHKPRQPSPDEHRLAALELRLRQKLDGVRADRADIRKAFHQQVFAAHCLESYLREAVKKCTLS